MTTKGYAAFPGEEIHDALRRLLESLEPGESGLLLFNGIDVPITRPTASEDSLEAAVRQGARIYYIEKGRAEALREKQTSDMPHKRVEEVTMWVGRCPRGFCGWASRPYAVLEDALARRRRHLRWRHFDRRTG